LVTYKNIKKEPGLKFKYSSYKLFHCIKSAGCS
jgi:hypothetical protein